MPGNSPVAGVIVDCEVHASPGSHGAYVLVCVAGRMGRAGPVRKLLLQPKGEIMKTETSAEMRNGCKSVSIVVLKIKIGNCCRLNGYGNPKRRAV